MEELDLIYRKIVELAEKKIINSMELSRETGVSEEKVRLALLVLRDSGRLRLEEVDCPSSCEACSFRKICTLKSPSLGKVFTVTLGRQ